jgi:hypothetical protein
VSMDDFASAGPSDYSLFSKTVTNMCRVGLSFDSEGVTGGQNDPPPPRRQDLVLSSLPSPEVFSTSHAAASPAL